MPVKVECSICGEKVLEAYTETDTDGTVVCDSCQSSWGVCRECNRWTDNHEEDINDYLCSSCCDEYYILCEWCENLVHRNNTYSDTTGTRICQSCRGDVDSCVHCGCWTDECDNNDDPCCSGCYEEYGHGGAHIHDYSHKPRPNFLPNKQSDALYMGVELETDNYNDIYEASEALYRLSKGEELFYQKEDGSLSCGIEVVTHPATLDFHRHQMPWTRIAETVGKHGGKSHDASTCGLHVHFNKDFFGDDTLENDACTLRLLYLVERFWEQIVVFSRRSPQDIREWASRYLQVFKDMPLEGYSQNKGWQGGHYAVNISPDSTNEVRVFRGTLKVSSLIAALEFVHLLTRIAKTYNTQKLYRLSWGMLAQKAGSKKYPALHQYLIDRKLKGKDRVKLPEDKENIKDLCDSNFNNLDQIYGTEPGRSPERPERQSYSTSIPDGGHFIDLTITDDVNVDGYVDGEPVFRRSGGESCDCGACTRLRPILDDPYHPPNRIRTRISEWSSFVIPSDYRWQPHDIDRDSNAVTIEVT